MVDFALKVGGLAETVVVVGEAPVVDTTSSATNTQLSQDLLFNMPIRQGNTATNLLNFAPGINNGAAYGGDANSGNGLLIDGVDTRDPSGGTAWTFYNYNIVEEVQFTGIGAPAEYGAFTGAIVNTITKSGGNQFSGLFDVIYTKSSFASKNVPAEFIGENPNLAQAAKTNKLVDFTTQIGGPIIKDKLFFFASAQRYQKDDDPIGPSTRRNEASDRLNGKLSWQPSPNDNVSAHVQFDNFNIIGRAGFNALLDADDDHEPGGRAGVPLGGPVAPPLRVEDVHGGQVHRVVGLLRPQSRDAATTPTPSPSPAGSTRTEPGTGRRGTPTSRIAAATRSTRRSPTTRRPSAITTSSSEWRWSAAGRETGTSTSPTASTTTTTGARPTWPTTTATTIRAATAASPCSRRTRGRSTTA